MFSAEEHAQQEKLLKLLSPADPALDKLSQQLAGDDPTFKEFFSECTTMYLNDDNNKTVPAAIEKTEGKNNCIKKTVFLGFFFLCQTFFLFFFYYKNLDMALLKPLRWTGS
jgi:hypothetical protein